MKKIWDFFLFLVNAIVYLKEKKKDPTRTLNNWHGDKNPPNKDMIV